MARRPPSAAERAAQAARVLTQSALEKSALWHLARRALTEAQLRAVLEKKLRAQPQHASDVDVDALVVKLTRLHFLDDARTALARTKMLRGRGESSRKIKARLRQQGLKGEQIDGALAAAREEAGAARADATPVDEELVAARRYVERRRLADKDPQKALAALARQGFSYATAKAALRGQDPDDDAN